MTRADRDRAHRQAVDSNKARIRQDMQNNPNDHVYGEETLREATRVKDYVEVDALAELMPEIREHNRKAGGGTKARVKEHIDRTRRREFERRQERDAERSRAHVQDYARSRPAPNFDAAANVPHGSALAAPAHARDSAREQEDAYRRELAEYDARRDEARRNREPFCEPPPTPPKTRQPVSPY